MGRASPTWGRRRWRPGPGDPAALGWAMWGPGAVSLHGKRGEMRNVLVSLGPGGWAPGHQLQWPPFFFKKKFIWLCWVLVAAHGV